MRRRAERERVQQEAELRLRLVLVEAITANRSPGCRAGGYGSSHHRSRCRCRRCRTRMPVPILDRCRKVVDSGLGEVKAWCIASTHRMRHGDVAGGHCRARRLRTAGRRPPGGNSQPASSISLSRRPISTWSHQAGPVPATAKKTQSPGSPTWPVRPAPTRRGSWPPGTDSAVLTESRRRVAALSGELLPAVQLPPRLAGAGRDDRADVGAGRPGRVGEVAGHLLQRQPEPQVGFVRRGVPSRHNTSCTGIGVDTSTPISRQMAVISSSLSSMMSSWSTKHSRCRVG